jgi:hypothetical protein
MTMPIDRQYFCSRCDARTSRDDLTVKKASFFEMGVGGKAIRSRVVDHLCPACLVTDPDFKREPFATPGTRQAMRPMPTQQT